MENIHKKAYIYLEGSDEVIEAMSFGADGTKTGEMIFNTSLSGYQEILTDPSYAGQFIVFTMPEIGIVGANDKDIESYSKKCHTSGIIVRNYNAFYSNFRALQSLHSFLKENNILGISCVDTRYLTQLIRNNGAINAVISTRFSSLKKLKEILETSPKIEEINHIKDISTYKSEVYNKSVFSFDTFDYQKPQFLGDKKKKIIAIDFGIKQNILNELSAVGLECEVVGYDFDATSIIERFEAKEIGGVFLSNGPGDPSVLVHQIQEIKKLILAKIPMFGICLGHQLLSLANGYKTYKLSFGHHGANHPVKNLLTNEVEITSQNHIYSIPETITKIATITHRNLFDGTIEGLKYNDFPIISIQHHPEASPGPKESTRIFKDFALMVKECDNAD